MERKEQIRLRLKLYDEQKDILQKHVAAILAFCVANDIEIAEGLEQANEIFAALATRLIEKGVYDKVKNDFKKDKKAIMQMYQARGRDEP